MRRRMHFNTHRLPDTTQTVVRCILVTVALFCVLAGSAAWAQQGTPAAELETLKRMLQEVISENQELARRIRELETAVAEQQQAAEDAAGGAAKAPTEADQDMASMINKYVSFGGAVEVEAAWNEHFDEPAGSDISLATAEFDFEARVDEWVTGTLVVDWDGDEDKLTVDEAFVTIGDTEAYPLFLEAGRMTVPFGISTGSSVSDTLTISDPLTIDVFEAKEDVIKLGAESGGFYGSAYVFNGDTNEGGGEDHIGHFGANVGYFIEDDDIGVDVGIDIISSVFDTDGLTEAFGDALTASGEPGIASHVKFRMGGFSLVTEYITALGNVDFTVDDEALSIMPKAWSVEGGYTIEIFGKETFFAVGYSESDDLVGEFPESRIAATIGSWLFEGFRLSFEYAHDKDYEEAEGGTGNSADAVTGQLTYEW